MSDYPKITVGITTCNRVEILKQALLRLKNNLIYSGDIAYLLGNDGNQESLTTMVNQLDFSQDIKIIGDGERHGLGANANRILRSCETEIILSSQDDYLLRDSLYLDEHVQKLLEDESAGWIRLRLTQGQNFTATVEHRYWQVDWHSQGMYIASDQPHLKHMRFHSYYGYYPEGLRVGDTENSWVGMTKNLGQQHPEWPGVLIPCNLACDHLWTHEGDNCSLKDAGF